MNLDFSYLQERLKEAKYEPELGVRLIQLTPTEFGGVKTISYCDSARSRKEVGSSFA